jgi:rod shape-determining protein MreD
MRVFGGQSDLILLTVLAWAVHSRLEVNVTWAFVGGIASDLMSASPTGASVVGLLIMVFVMDRLKRQLFNISFIVLLGMVLLGTLIQQIVFMIAIALTGSTIRPFEQFFYTTLPSMAYNLVFIVPVYWFVRRVQRLFLGERRLERRGITLESR